MSDVSSMATAVTLAKPGLWRIDPAHSGLEFSVRHLMVSRVRGRFPGISGTVLTDGTVQGTQVSVEVDATGVDTRNPDRDTHLRSADFFDTGLYPQITFVSSSVVAEGENEFLVSGDLTIRNETRPVQIRVVHEGTTRDPWGSDRAGFSATFRIDRRDFGLTWNQALEAGGVMVSNEVDLTADLELTLAPDSSAQP